MAENESFARNAVQSSAAAVSLVTIAALLVFARAGLAQVRVGEVITADNAAKVRDLVSPGVYYAVQHDMRMNLVVPQRIDWPPPYRDATEKYSAQARLDSNRKSLVGYVAGQPFPLIDPNDPDAAAKIIWNLNFPPEATDDYFIRNHCEETQYMKPGAARNIIQQIITNEAEYKEIGRTEVEPMPFDPDFRSSGVIWRAAQYPVFSPADIKGSGYMRFRYADPRRGDDLWVYISQTRRLRRFDESSFSDAPLSQVADPEHGLGSPMAYLPKPEFWNMKLLGEKDMLACMHARNSPAVVCPYDGGATVCPENWEMRHLYVVELTPADPVYRRSLDSKTIAYIDSEAWINPYYDMYNREGQLWRTRINFITFRDRPIPDARVAIYPFKRLFATARTFIDLQSGFTSTDYLPWPRSAERECWYVNMGAYDLNHFTPAAMANAEASR